MELDKIKKVLKELAEELEKVKAFMTEIEATPDNGRETLQNDTETSEPDVSTVDTQDVQEAKPVEDPDIKEDQKEEPQVEEIKEELQVEVPEEEPEGEPEIPKEDYGEINQKPENIRDDDNIPNFQKGVEEEPEALTDDETGEELPVDFKQIVDAQNAKIIALEAENKQLKAKVAGAFGYSSKPVMPAKTNRLYDENLDNIHFKKI